MGAFVISDQDISMCCSSKAMTRYGKFFCEKNSCGIFLVGKSCHTQITITNSWQNMKLTLRCHGKKKKTNSCAVLKFIKPPTQTHMEPKHFQETKIQENIYVFSFFLKITIFKLVLWEFSMCMWSTNVLGFWLAWSCTGLVQTAAWVHECIVTNSRHCFASVFPGSCALPGSSSLMATKHWRGLWHRDIFKWKMNEIVQKTLLKRRANTSPLREGENYTR